MKKISGYSELVELGFETGNYIMNNVAEDYNTLYYQLENDISNDNEFKLIPVNPGTKLYAEYGYGDTYIIVIEPKE